MVFTNGFYKILCNADNRPSSVLLKNSVHKAVAYACIYTEIYMDFAVVTRIFFKYVFGAVRRPVVAHKQRNFQIRLEKTDFNESKFAGAVGGSYREKEILPQEVFTEYIDLPFEGKEFKAIAAYDAYLSSIYGDYMKLPPENKVFS